MYKNLTLCQILLVMALSNIFLGGIVRLEGSINSMDTLLEILSFLIQLTQSTFNRNDAKTNVANLYMITI
jgi:hypothetical protein